MLWYTSEPLGFQHTRVLAGVGVLHTRSSSSSAARYSDSMGRHVSA